MRVTVEAGRESVKSRPQRRELERVAVGREKEEEEEDEAVEVDGELILLTCVVGGVAFVCCACCFNLIFCIVAFLLLMAAK